MARSLVWTMIRSAVLLTAGAWLLAACGGSVEFRADPGGAAGTSAGGSVSAGASFGGASSGSTSGGNTSSGGAGVDCTHVACTAIGCGPGLKPILEPGACCTTCVPDGSGGGGGSGSSGGGGGSGGNPCAITTCPRPLCARGFMYADVPGQCCGSCVPDPNACPNAQAEYRALRDKLLAAPEATSCSVGADCQWLATSAPCGDPCPSHAVSVKAAVMLEQQLANFAESSCSFCPATLPPCAAPPPPVCSAGQCLFGGNG